MNNIYVKTIGSLVIIALVIFLIIRLNKNQPTPAETPTPTPQATTPNNSSSLPNQYNGAGFSIKYPTGFTVDTNYVYTLPPATPTKKEVKITGVQFTVSPSFTTGTNLSTDSYISIEKLDVEMGETCNAEMFLNGSISTKDESSSIKEEGITYSVMSRGEAAAGNYYEETVYVPVVGKPCFAVRYFIHSGNIGNWDPGTVKEFDKRALVAAFDEIRKSLVVSQ